MPESFATTAATATGQKFDQKVERNLNQKVEK
jgi:hypothetical protein